MKSFNCRYSLLFKSILILCLFVASLRVAAQNSLQNGCVILESGDTIYGLLSDKTYTSQNSVKLYKDDQNLLFPMRKIDEIHVGDNVFVKSSYWNIWHRYYRKEISGSVNLYYYSSFIRIAANDADIYNGRIRPTLKFYCSDYPGLLDTLRFVDANNVANFIDTYNDWKLDNPESKSFFEENIHNIPLFNFKFSIYAPSIGLEIALWKGLSFNAMVKDDLFSDKLFNPFVVTQMRYYYNLRKRIAEDKRTYKFSANYLCVENKYFTDLSASLVGVEYGFQQIINKRWYYNISAGAGKWIYGKSGFLLLYEIDFGINLNN